MRTRTRKVIFDAHSWLGVTSSILLFVVCFTGLAALFRYELAAWENPDLRTNERRDIGEALPIDKALKIAITEHNIRSDEFFINLPSTRYGKHYRFLSREETTQIPTEVYLDAFTGEKLELSQSDLANFLSHMHTDLNLPRPLGRYLVGFLGVLMLFSVISGIIAHRHFFKEIFQFRPGKNQKLTVTDMHKVMGAWGILFQLMMAFTGALIGLVGLFLIVMALAAYGGDQQAAIEGFLGPHIDAIGQSATMTNIDQLVARTEAYWPGFEAQFINAHAYGDQMARIEISGNMSQHLAGSQSITYDGVSGEPTFIADFMQMGPGARIFAAAPILHYAIYGGFVIKVLYFLLGIGMTLMVSTGMMIWVKKRASTNNTYNRLTKFNVGATLGVVIATAAIFCINKLLPESNGKARYEQWGFFLMWLVAIVWASIRSDHYRTTKQLLFGSAFLFMLAPMLNAVTTGHHLITSYREGYYTVFGTDLTLLIVGIAMALAAFRWPLSSDKKVARVPTVNDPSLASNII